MVSWHKKENSYNHKSLVQISIYVFWCMADRQTGKLNCFLLDGIIIKKINYGVALLLKLLQK